MPVIMHYFKLCLVITNLLLTIYIGVFKKGKTSNKHFSSNRITEQKPVTHCMILHKP